MVFLSLPRKTSAMSMPNHSQHLQQPEPQPTGAPAPRKLSTFLKVSIVLLAALSVASISLLFIGDFDGKFERVFATFAIFAVFVLLTAFDTRRELRSSWYAPVALIANAYILGLLLIVTWMTPYDPFFLGWEIFWKSIVVIGVTRAVLGCCQLLLGMGNGRPETLTRFAFATSVLAVLSGILFTAPIAIETFDLHIPELYWKIAVATLLLTALGLAITLLLRWFYSAQDREATRVAKQQMAALAQPAPYYGNVHTAAGHGGAPIPAPAAAPIPAPAPAPVTAAASSQAPAPAPYVVPTPAPDPLSVQAPTPEPAQGQPLLPWPTFADGRPLPVRPDGQPDFSVPGAPLPPQQ